MKIPTSNPVGNGYFNYGGAPFSLDNSGTENGTSTNSDPIEDCDSPTADGDFSEYLWMEHEEEFDRQVLQELEEEALMEECLEAMLDEQLLSEQELNDCPGVVVALNATAELCLAMNGLTMDNYATELAKSSKLNPLAAEFVPSTRPEQLPQTDPKQTPPGPPNS